MVSLDNLVRKGYFPKELIPAFNTEGLADSLPSLEPRLSSPSFGPKYSIPYSFSIPRPPYKRRHLCIPNPLHQIRLCKEITDNWTELDTFLRSSDLSLSTPIEKPDKERALEMQVELRQLSTERSKFSVGHHYLLKTDISDYYQSIYTHSIAWALHGRDRAMADRFTYALLGSRLDRCVRNTQEQQSIGIPIGPDTSLLLSEIVGVTLDKTIKSSFGSFDGCRFIDDYYLYFDTLAIAEEALYKIQCLLKDYKQEINPEKTKIIKLPEVVEPRWVSELSGYEFRDTTKKQQADILRFFNRAFEFSKEFPHDSVIRYSLQVIKGIIIEKENWSVCESLLLNSLMLQSNILSDITQILLAYKEKNYPLDIEAISKTMKSIILENAKLGNIHEIVWSLWLSKSLNIRLEKPVVDVISKIEDPLVALVSLDIHKNNNNNLECLDTSTWQALMNEDELYSRNWLLAYEAYIKDLLIPNDGIDYISDDDFFSILKSNNVYFYDSERQVSLDKVSISEGEY
jgi:hypothetical protein